MKYLIKQATIIPVLFFVPVFIAGALVDGYDPIKQQGSEITITDFYTAKAILNTGAMLSGLSCILLGLGILLNFKKYVLTSVLLMIFGISMVSNGIYPMGTPMHGLYGMGLTLMIAPFVACYEWKNEPVRRDFFRVSLLSGSVIFIYLWSICVGLDPENYRGLTQRVASVFIFGWIAYLAFAIGQTQPDPGHKT